MADGLGDLGQFVLQFASFFGEFDNHLPRILLTLRTGKDTFSLHSFEKRSDRVGLQHQPFGDVVHRL